MGQLRGKIRELPEQQESSSRLLRRLRRTSATRRTTALDTGRGRHGSSSGTTGAAQQAWDSARTWGRDDTTGEGGEQARARAVVGTLKALAQQRPDAVTLLDGFPDAALDTWPAPVPEAVRVVLRETGGLEADGIPYAFGPRGTPHGRRPFADGHWTLGEPHWGQGSLTVGPGGGWRADWSRSRPSGRTTNRKPPSRPRRSPAGSSPSPNGSPTLARWRNGPCPRSSSSPSVGRDRRERGDGRRAGGTGRPG
ncbi:hypothetical protein GCM10010446_31350 [Streptomyces enissocaesilis]|uniref:Uncharacterized protein n=1 Tax=Streptomyces enissocaesilis TaxID=332589 RepID=A0ABN3X937_9ACTN